MAKKKINNNKIKVNIFLLIFNTFPTQGLPSNSLANSVNAFIFIAWFIFDKSRDIERIPRNTAAGRVRRVPKVYGVFVRFAIKIKLINAEVILHAPNIILSNNATKSQSIGAWGLIFTDFINSTHFFKTFIHSFL